MADTGHGTAPAPRRHPAMWSAWKWLEEGDGRERDEAEREYLDEKFRDLDVALFELDEGTSYVV